MNSSTQKAEAHLKTWPIPGSAIDIGDHMWALTLVPPKRNVRPQLHSQTVLALRITAYDTAGKVVNGPMVRIASVDYFEPRWQRLYLQMAIGEVRRVWVVDPQEPPQIFDVALRNIVDVE